MKALSNTQKAVIEDQGIAITALKTELEGAQEEIVKLKGGLNDLRQYSRRNSLRIYNPEWIEVPGEETDRMVLQLAWNMGVNINEWEIDRLIYYMSYFL